MNMLLLNKLSELPKKYTITERLPKTQFSTLYKGFDQETEKQIVIKQCLYHNDFRREVIASVKIFAKGYNEHIVPVLASYPDTRILVMPYLEAGLVWDLRRKKKGLTPEEVLDITAQTGKALEQVHAVGIIHNDIKSGNILLTGSEKSDQKLTAKLTDFGLSCCQIPRLEPDRGAGTREYSAPEKFKTSGTLTSAVDIYSLGLMIHEMLTNTLIYGDISYSNRLDDSDIEKILHQRAKPIPAHEKIPEKILPVIRTACEYKPKNRYRNVTEMISALEKAVHGV